MMADAMAVAVGRACHGSANRLTRHGPVITDGRFVSIPARHEATARRRPLLRSCDRLGSPQDREGNYRDHRPDRTVTVWDVLEELRSSLDQISQGALIPQYDDLGNELAPKHTPGYRTCGTSSRPHVETATARGPWAAGDRRASSTKRAIRFLR